MTASPLLRRRLASSTALALALFGGAVPAAAGSPGGAFAGSYVINSGPVAIGRASGLDTITISGEGNSTAVITWTPTDTATSKTPVAFLPNGSTAAYVGSAGVTDFTVINRVLPADATRAVQYDGAVTSTLNQAGANVPGGTVVFFTPGGVILGPTASFNVGSLLLTTADPVLNGSTLTLNSATDSTSKVMIAKGATVNAQSNYVALVAPRVQQDGAVTVAGGAAYIAAEAVDLTILGSGLFDIRINAGSAKDPAETAPVTALSHTGTTTGATPAGGTNPRIVMAAIPKNDAITMLVGGTVGFTPANGASVSDGTVELFAGVPGSDNGAHSVAGSPPSIAPASLDLTASSTTNLYAEATTQARLTPSTTGQIGLTQTLTGTVGLLGGTKTVIDTAGLNTVSINGDVILGGQSNGNGEGRTATLTASAGQLTFGGSLFALFNANRFPTAAKGGTIGVDVSAGGRLTVAGTAAFTASATSQLGTAQGGTVALTVNGGQATFGTLSLDVSGTSGLGVAGTGGMGTISLGDQSSLNAGDLSIVATGFAGTAASTGLGGIASLTVGSGASTQMASLSLDAGGQGGGTATGGAASLIASPGSIAVTIDQAATIGATGVSSGTLDVDGGNGRGGTAAVTVSTGTLTIGDTLRVNGYGFGAAASSNLASDGSAGLAGGSGTGGTATFTFSGGSSNLSGVILNATGTGGTGGSGAMNFSGPAGVGGAGGLGTAGTASFKVTGTGTVLGLQAGGIDVQAIGFGGSGGSGQSNSPPDEQGAAGGIGGAAVGGNASVSVDLGGKIVGLSTGSLNLEALAQAGYGGPGGYGTSANGPSGPQGLSAKGGTAAVTLDNGTVDFASGSVGLYAQGASGGPAMGGNATLTLKNGAALTSAGISLDASGAASLPASAVGGSATIAIDSAMLTTGDVSVSAGASAENGVSAGIATVTGGTAAFDIIGASGTPATADMASLDVNAGSYTNRIVANGGTTAPAAVGGTARLAVGANTTVTAGTLGVSADANAASVQSDAVTAGTGGAATGGMATVSVSGGSLTTTDTFSSTNVTANARGGYALSSSRLGSGTPGGSGGAASGGTAMVSADSAGTISLGSLNVSASGSGGSGGDADYAMSGTGSAGGAGGSGSGGTARITLTGGATLIAPTTEAEGFVGVAASATGTGGAGGAGGDIGDRYASPPFVQGTGGAGGAGGAASGGIASVSVDLGGSIVANASLTADGHATGGRGAYGGVGDLNIYGNYGPDGGGSSVTAQTASVTVGSGASLTVGRATLIDARAASTDADATGGSAGLTIAGGTVALDSLSVLGGATAEGVGFVTGGAARLGIDGLGASLTATGVTIGASGSASRRFSSVTLPSAIVGGIASLTIGAAGQVTIDSLAIAAAGNARNGAPGAPGLGGQALLQIGAGSGSLDVANTLSLDASAQGADGPGPSGSGGGGLGGVAGATLLGGTLTVRGDGGMTLSTAAIGGNGALPSDPVNGGDAMGGYSHVDIGGSASVSLTSLTLDAGATSGDGAPGLIVNGFADAGGVGGAARGGTAAFGIDGTATATIAGTLSVTARAVGGAGGRGSNGAVGTAGTPGQPAEGPDNGPPVDGGAGGDGSPGGDGGTGGVGGTATGGQAMVTIAGSGGGAGYQVQLGSLVLDAKATSGVGGNGGDGGAGGVGGAGGAGVAGGNAGPDGAMGAPGAGGIGGQGGDVTSGSISLSLPNGTLTTGATMIDATIVQSAGGIYGYAGDGTPPVFGAPNGSGYAGGGASLSMSGTKAVVLGDTVTINAAGPVAIDAGSTDAGFTGGTFALASGTSIATTAALGSATAPITSATFIGTGLAGESVPVFIGGAITATGAVAVSTIGDVIINGAVSAASLDAEMADGDFAAGGALTLGSLTLNSFGSDRTVALTGPTTLTGNATISAYGAVSLDGAFSGDVQNSTVAISSATSIEFSQGLDAATLTLTGTAPGATISTYGTSTLGAATITAPGLITLGYGLSVANALNVTSNTGIIVTGPVDAGTATLTGTEGTGAGISFVGTGSLFATDDLTINVDGAAALNGYQVRSAYGRLSITASAIDSTGDLEAAALDLTARSGAVSLGGTTRVDGATTINAPGQITLGGTEYHGSLVAASPTGVAVGPGGSITVNGTTSLTSTSGPVSIAATGSLIGQGAVTLGTPGAITIDGALGGTDVFAIGASVTGNGVITATNLTVSGSGAGAPVTLGGVGSVVTNATMIDTSGPVTLSGSLTTGSLTVNSGAAVDVAYTSLVAGGVMLATTGAGATLHLGGNSAVAGPVSLTAPGSVTIDGTQQTKALTVQSDTAITVAGAVQATDATLTGTKNTGATIAINAGGALDTLTSATLVAPGAITLAGGLSGPTVAVTSDSGIAASGTISATTLTLRGTTGTGATIALGGTTIVTGTASVFAPGNVTLTGQIRGNGAIDLGSTGGLLSVNDTRLNASALTLSGGTGIVLDGVSTVSGQTSAANFAPITVAGTQAAQSFKLFSGTGVTVAGSLTAPNSIDLEGNTGTSAGVTLTATGTLAGGTVSLIAPGAVSAMGTIGGGAVLLQSATSVRESGAVTAASLTLTGTGAGTGIVLGGSSAVTGATQLAAPGAITIAGTHRADSFSAISATGTDVTGAVNVANFIVLSGYTGTYAGVTVEAPATLTGANASTISLRAPGAVVLAGSVTGGSIDLLSATGITATGSLGAATLTASTNTAGATIDVGGTTTVTGTATLVAPGAVTLTGQFLGGGTLAVQSGTRLSVNDSRLDAAALQLSGNSLTPIAFAGVSNVTGHTQLDGGAITLAGTQRADSFTANFATSLDVTGTVAATHGIVFSGLNNPGSHATLEAPGVLTGDVSITTPGDIVVAGTINGGAVTLQSGTRVSTTGTLGATTLGIQGTSASATADVGGTTTLSGLASIAAPGGMTLTGQVLGTGALSLSSAANISVNDTRLDAASLSVSGGSIALAGVSSVSGDTNLGASGAVDIGGSHQAQRFIAGSATGVTVHAIIAAPTLLNLFGQANTAAGVTVAAGSALQGATISINAPGAVDVAGTVTGTSVTEQSGTAVRSTAALTATTLTLGGTAPSATIALDGTSIVGSSTTLSAPGAVTIGGTQRAASFSATSDTGIDVTGAVTATQFVSLAGRSGTTAGITVEAPGVLTGDVGLDAPGAVVVAGTINGGAVALFSGTRISSTGTLLATNGLSARGIGAAPIDLASLTSANGLTISSPARVTLGALTLGAQSQNLYVVSSGTGVSITGPVTGTVLNVLGTAPGATVAISAPVTLIDGLSIQGPGAVSLTGTFDGGALSASSGTSVSVAETRLVASGLTLTGTAPGATISLGGPSTVSGTTTLTAPTLITVAGNQSAGTFVAASDSGVSVTGAVQAGDVTLTGNTGTGATVTVARTASVTGSRTVSIAAPGAVTLTGSVAAPTLAVSSDTAIAAGTTVSGVPSGTLSGSAITLTGTTPAATVTLAGILNDTGTATITGPAGVALSGSFTGGGALSASSAKSVSVNYAQLTASGLTLTGTAPGATISLGGTSTVGGTTRLTAPTLITIAGNQSAGTFVAASDSGVSVTGAVQAGDVTLTGNAGTGARVTVASTGSVSGSKTVGITGSGAVTLAGAVSAPVVTLASATAIAATGTLAATTLTLTGIAGVPTAPPTTVALGGTTTVTGATTITAPGAVRLTGQLLGGGTVTASSASRIDVGDTRLDASALTLTGTAPGATVALGGVSNVAGATTLAAPGAITVAGSEQAETFTAASDSGIGVTGAIAARDVTLTGNSGTGATVAVASTGAIAATNSATITAPGTVTLDGAVGAPTLVVSSDRGIASAGTLSGQAITLTGTAPAATVVLTGLLADAGTATIVGPAGVALSGAFSGGGALTASSDTSIVVNYPNLTVGALTLSGGPGSVSLGGNSVVAGALTLRGGVVQIAGSQQASAFDLISSAPIAINGALVAPDIRLTAVGSGGTAPGVTVAATGSLTGNTTIAAAGALVVDGSITGATVDLSSATRIDAGGHLAATTLTATGTAAGATVRIADAAVTGQTTIDGPGGVTLSGLTGSSDAIVRSATRIDAAAIRAASLRLDGSAGTLAPITLGGATTVTGSTTIVSNGPVALSGSFAGGPLAITSGTAIAVADTALTTPVLTLTGTGGAGIALGGRVMAGMAALTTAGGVTIGTAGDQTPGAVTAGTLTIAGASAVDLVAPVTAGDLMIRGVDGVTAVNVAAPVSVTQGFTVAHGGSFTSTAAIDPQSITIDVTGLVNVTDLLDAGRVTIDAGDINLTGRVHATGVAEFLTSAAKTSAATVGGAGGAAGYDLDAGELQRISANRILVSTGPLASGNSSSGGGTTGVLDLAVGTLTLAGSAAQNSNLTGTGAAFAVAASGALNIAGQVGVTSAGATDAVVLAAAGPIRVTTPAGVAITDALGAPAGELYAYAPQLVVASAATAATLAATPAFADRAALLRTNDGPLAPAGYLQAGRVEVRAATGLFVENSGDTTTYAGITTGDGGLGFRAGSIAGGAVIAGGGLGGLASVDALDGFLSRGAPADVIAFGRQLTSGGSVVVNDDFAKTVRTTRADVTVLSSVNDCTIPGGICISGAFQGTPAVSQGTATFMRSGTAKGDGVDVITIAASQSPATIITWTPYDKTGTGPVDFLPKGNVATFAGTPGLGSFTVINRVLPLDATRPVAFNGSTLSRLTSTTGLASPGGTVVFFAPGGLVVGPSGVFDVGSLLLTTADPVLSGNGFHLAGASGSTVGVTVAPGASITASTPGGFVDLVAPRVRQDGTVTVAGDAVYVAAESADVAVNADGSTAIALTRASSVGSAPLLLEHGGTTSGTAGANATIVLAAAGDGARIDVGGTLGYAKGGQVIVTAGTNATGVTVATAQPADLRLAPDVVTSPLVATASRDIALGAAGGSRFTGAATLAFGGNLTVIGPVTAAALTASGTGPASTIAVNAPLTAPDTILTAAGAISLTAAVTAVNTLTVATPGLLTITSAVDPALIRFTVGDIAITPTGHVGDASTEEIAIIADTNQARSATVGGAPSQGGFDLDSGEFSRLQANRIVISTGFGTTARPLDIHVGDLSVRGSAATGGNLVAGAGAPTVVIASSRDLYVDGQVGIANAGPSDALGMLAAGRVIVTPPNGGISLTGPGGGLAGQLYLLGGDIVAGSAPAQAAVAAAGDFAGRRSALGLNDGAENDAGYIRAGMIEVRAASRFYNQNSGSHGVYAGLSAGDGRLGFRQGVFVGRSVDIGDLAAVDAAVRSTGSAEVIAFGRDITLTGSVVNAAFLPTVRIAPTDVVVTSEINGCPIIGGACRDPRGDGTPLDRAAQLTGEIVRPAQDIIAEATSEAAAQDAVIAAQTVTFAPPRLVDLSAVTITAGIGDPATGAGDETMWDPLAPPDAPPPSDGRAGKRPTVAVKPAAGSAKR